MMRYVIVISALLMVGVAGARAAGDGPDGGPTTRPTTQLSDEGAPTGAMGSTQQEMMANMMANMAAYAATGPEHEYLKQRVGNWEYTVKMWHAPGAQPMVTTGTTVAKLIMGGRFLLDRSMGMVHGQAFEGMGITGFDRIKNKYFGVWIDNMGTGMYASEGDVDDAGKVFNSTSTYSCSMTGTIKQARSVETIIDADTWKSEMYERGDDDGEWKTFEIVYKRAQ